MTDALIGKQKIFVNKFDIHALRIGYYADKYFLRTRDILFKDNFEGTVHYQYFPRKDVVLSGEKVVREIFKRCTGYYSDLEKALNLFERLKFSLQSEEYPVYIESLDRMLDELWIDKYQEIEYHASYDGKELKKDIQPCIGIVGNPKYFAHLETATLGILAQQSAIATSVREVIKRLNPNQELLFFPARFRHFHCQAPDGHAAVVGGAHYMSTDANYEYDKGKGIGTIPHLLIAAYKGNTAKAAIKFDEYMDPDINRVILVDWDNDCIGTTLQVMVSFIYKFIYQLGFTDVSSLTFEEAKNTIERASEDIKEIIGKGKGKIFGVRFDTSGTNIDQGVTYTHVNRGVCPELIFTARKVFDALGLHDLKIIVSGGFDIEKIELFQSLNVPVDMYGIGSSIVNKFHCDFTADAVTLNGEPNAKIGRGLLNWSETMKHII